MKFFFPDAHDYVDPDFDFKAECLGAERERHRTDQYAHELLGEAPYDGLLVSRSIVHGAGGKSGKYTLAQRHRLYREGAHRFFRVDHLRTADGRPFPIMGDCGAFSYIAEDSPPVSVAEAIEFYERCGFTHGQSIDHVIVHYRPDWDDRALYEVGPPRAVRGRFELTLRLAREFLEEHVRRGCRFEPVGIAQGWSAQSYGEAVLRLQEMGYRYVALGGLVPLKTDDLLTVLRHVMPLARSDVRIHVLGVVRWDCLDEIIVLGIASFDSTSPLRQAFLDSRTNYYAGATSDEAYAAIRIPQMDGNPRLKRRMLAGQLHGDEVRQLEERCLSAVRAYDKNPESVELDRLLDDLDRYLRFLTPNADWRRKNERVLRDRPWEACPCRVCRDIGIEVMLFRGANRNRRRGFHNLHVAYQRLQAALKRVGAPAGARR